MTTWTTARNLLCVRLDALGDVLMTIPAMRALKQTAHGSRVTLLTSRSGAAIARMVPEVDECIVYDAPWIKATAPRRSGRPDFQMIERLRGHRFDAAVIFTVYSQNPLPAAFLCFLAGIPLRLAHCRENPYQLLTDRVPEPEPEQMIRHEVQRQLDLVSAVGASSVDPRMSLRVPAAAQRRASQVLEEMGVDRARPWAVVHAGATAPSRRYPPEQFAAAARMLVCDEGFQLVFTGSHDEHDLVEQIRADMRAPSHDAVGRLDLPELAALLSKAPLLISNNTGPVHIAAALGTPVVDLYALTNPQHTPWAVPHRVLSHDVPCKYCYKSVCPHGHNDCLRLVTPEQVVTAARELYAETQGGPRPAATGPLVGLAA